MIVYAAAVFGDCHADYICNAAARPHITLAQVETDQPELATAAVAPFIGRPMLLRFKGVYLDVKKNSRMSAGLRLANNPALQTLHEDVVVALAARGVAVNNAAKENYWPHLTLAHNVDITNMDVAAIHNARLFADPIECVVEWGKAGDGWEYRR